MTPEESQGRLYWSCRRGMLELDLLLIPFQEKCYSQLTPPEQTLFQQFLESTDMELYEWLTHPETMPAHLPYAPLITAILTYAQTHRSATSK